MHVTPETITKTKRDNKQGKRVELRYQRNDHAARKKSLIKFARYGRVSSQQTHLPEIAWSFFVMNFVPCKKGQNTPEWSVALQQTG